MPPASTLLDLTFRALADQTRRSIIERLSQGEASVSELAQPHDMSLPAIVQHLALLEECGLVRSDKVGRVRTCRIDPAAFSLAEQWLTQRRVQWDQRLDRLGEHLKRFPDGEPT